MPTPRKDIIRKGEEGIYHCHSRCVRRAYLCGKDSYSGRNYEHRRQWVHARLKWLVDSFSMEVVTCSVMFNHHHVILRTRPDLLKGLSADQVARRWLRALPRRFDEKWQPLPIVEQEVERITNDQGRVRKLRSRLSDVSWFMGFLNEFIARRANAEDGVSGSFFEGRYKGRALLDEASVLACMAYVDLNPIRGKVAESPELSTFTGAYDRILARQGKAKIYALAAARRSGASLVPSRGRLNEVQTEEIRRAKQARTQDRWLCQLDNRKGARPSLMRRGLIPISVEEYLELLDWTGRQIRADKRGVIPGHLEPILKRLSFDVRAWLQMVEDMGDLFWRVVGRVDLILNAAQAAGRRWFKGLAASRMIFGPG